MVKKITSQSSAAFQKAKKALAGGVNSPVRSFTSVEAPPVFFEKGKGSLLYDCDKRSYIDYCQSWGALILGHAHSTIQKAIVKQTSLGTSFGMPTTLETQLAELLKKRFASCEQFRFVSSGTEAVMTAIRLARGITNRPKIVKFEGCYHGHSDSLLVKAGSGLATFGKSSSLGISEKLARETIVLPYNNLKALDACFKKHNDISCVIVEPVAGNMGVIKPSPEFLKKLRSLTLKTKSILIFDEVITGLRAGPRGAQEYFKIKPDITTLGKVIGGGLPVGAIGASKKIMSFLSPEGPVYQAGTLSGNPLTMRAGIATMKKLDQKGLMQRLSINTKKFTKNLECVFRANKIKAHVPFIGSMFGIFFQSNLPTSYSDITQGHVKIYKEFFRHMLDNGVFIPPSAYEAFFLSTEHRSVDLKKTIAVAQEFRL